MNGLERIGPRPTARGRWSISRLAIALVGLSLATFAQQCVLAAVPIAQAASGPITANGSIFCSLSVGKIVFKPPISNSGTMPETVTTHVKASQCTTTGNTNLPKKPIIGEFDVTSHSSANTCTNLGFGPTVSGSVKWRESGVKITPTTIVTSGVSFVTSSTQSLIEMHKPHQLIGSFSAGTYTYPDYADWVLKQTAGQISAACASPGGIRKAGSGGLKEVTVVSGSDSFP